MTNAQTSKSVAHDCRFYSHLLVGEFCTNFGIVIHDQSGKFLIILWGKAGNIFDAMRFTFSVLVLADIL